MTSYQLYANLKTTENGLSDEDHKLYLEKYGLNEITPPKETPGWIRLLKKMIGGF